ncbi:MAG: TonB-dependent receptor [Bacteroidales bacterium]|nr:TonB-dependent receptor [Bacteroidales bacterium]
MNKVCIIVILNILMINQIQAQKATISGYVYDQATGETIIGANVFTENTQNGTATNSYGYFVLTTNKGEHSVNASFLSYSTEQVNLNLQNDTVINFYLQSSDNVLDEITVSANAQHSNRNEYAQINLTPLEIRMLPTVFGEPDPIKAIQLQTGIKTIGDGTSGFYVQGGNIDQNLILIDEAPIYNPSHLFGMVSVFNPDAVKEVKFYKGNSPAKYGGRLSSVTDVKMNEGNMNSFQMSGGVSILSARLTMQAPIVKDKASFFVSARRSFIDLFIEPSNDENIIPQFYDLNIKTNYKINRNNRIFVSFYKGNDKILSVGDFTNIWGNQTATLRYNHIFSPRVFSNISFIYSDYQNQIQFSEQKQQISWTTAIQDFTGKTDFAFFISSNNKIEFGTNTVLHSFTPGKANNPVLQDIPSSQALENAVYLLNDIDLFGKIGINYGLRLSFFQNIGQATWFDYDENYIPINENSNKTGVYNTYKNFQPRISAKYFINNKITFKTAYSRTSQYVQLLQNNAYSYTSLETWIPASPNIMPQTADIISAGIDYSGNDNYYFSINSYFKKFHYQIDYIDHARLIGTKYIETQIRTGTAKAYGIEVNLQKTNGKLTGNVSYNFSRAIRTISGINNNRSYPASYDMPHDARISVNYNLTKRLSVGAFWIYSTGRAFTMPAGYFEFENAYVPIYTERNGQRMPDYHRLDIALNINPKPNSKLNSNWKIGIYNVYVRQNPLGYNFEYDASMQKLRVYQFNFITIMPSISYSFKF